MTSSNGNLSRRELEVLKQKMSPEMLKAVSSNASKNIEEFNRELEHYRAQSMMALARNSRMVVRGR